jgi:hypothetical protein
VPPDRWDEWNAELQKSIRKGRRVSVIAALSRVAVVAGLFVEPSVMIYTAIIYATMIAYFALYSRHHLVAEAKEEHIASGPYTRS